MPRKRHVTAYLRTTREGRFWYGSWYEHGKRVVRPTGIERNTKQKDRGKAEAVDAARRVMEARSVARAGELTPFMEYASMFFVWGKCPHVRRLLDEGKEITRRWADHQRGWLLRYVIGDAKAKIAPDPLALKPLGEITRADLVDFRSRLLGKLGEKRNTANKVMGTVKVIFKEALFREEISRDPTFKLGTMREYRQEPGVFTQEEIRALFPSEGLGPWKDKITFTCFLLAAESGMRRGEIIVLRWGNVDFDKARIYVTEAWKGGKEIGAPKWGRKREFALPTFTAVKLKELKETSERTEDEDFIFADLNGARFGETWWLKRFGAAMKSADIDVKARHITPHSFRHTLNSLLLAAGADPMKVRLALGWASARIQENYLHLAVSQLKDVSDKVDAIFTR
jgi:integrase